MSISTVSTAVSIYIQHKVLRLARLKKYDNKTENAVRDYLSLNANDTFLWVALACQKLEKISRWKTVAVLNSFPPGLDSLYERMIDLICNMEDIGNVNLCKQILSIVTIVYRPITPNELTSLAEGLRDTSDDFESLKDIVGLCGSFLATREDTIYFVHQSAKDFLLTKARDKIFFSGAEDVHYTIFL
jgi:hypothetical protein